MVVVVAGDHALQKTLGLPYVARFACPRGL